MGRQHQPVILETVPVRRAAHAHRHAVGRDGRIGQAVGPFELRYAAVLHAVGLVGVAAEERRIGQILAEVDAVAAAHQPQVRHRRQIIGAPVGDHPRVREVQIGRGGRNAHDRHAVRGVEHREADLPVVLLGTLGHADKQPRAAVKAEGARIEQALDFHPFAARPQVAGCQNRIVGIAHGVSFFVNKGTFSSVPRCVLSSQKSIISIQHARASERMSLTCRHMIYELLSRSGE